MKKATIAIKNKEGLHARPAGTFAKVAAKAKADIKLYKNDDETKSYNAKNILSILSMGAVQGDKLTLVVEGEDEDTIIRELTDTLTNDLNA